MLRAAFALVAALLVGSGAYAGTASWGCGFSGTSAGVAGTAAGTSNTKMVVSANERWCYRYVNADAVTTIIGKLVVTSESALVVFDPDIFDTAISTARMIPYMCPIGVANDTTTLATIKRSCLSIGGANGNASLDGTEGAATTQNAAVRVGPGTYYFEISAVCAAGDTCQITVIGESGVQ